jgi:hypothetical protein
MSKSVKVGVCLRPPNAGKNRMRVYFDKLALVERMKAIHAAKVKANEPRS